MNDKKINFNTFFRSLVCSYGLWFDNNKVEEEDFSDLIMISDLDEDEEEQSVAYSNEMPTEIFVEYENALSNFFMKETSVTEKDWINSKESIAKQTETLDAFKNEEKRWIVRGKVVSNLYNADLNFYAYDKQDQVLYIESFRDTLMLKEIAKAFYSYHLMNQFFKENGFEKQFKIKDIKYVCRQQVDDPKVKTFYFKISDVAAPIKSKPSGKIVEFIGKSNTYNLKFYELFPETKIINVIKTQIAFSISIVTKIAKDMSSNEILSNRSAFKVVPVDNLDFPNFDHHMKFIELSRNYQFDIETYRGRESDFFEENNTAWGKNPDLAQWYPILLGYNIANLQGTKFKKSSSCAAIERKGDVDHLVLEYFANVAIDKKELKLSKDQIEAELEKLEAKNIVWYDYESINLPYAVLEFTKPYQQIVSQMSVFRSVNNEIISTKDLVWDPQSLSLMDFVDLFYNLYWEQADQYVVYNKGFENTRNKEMAIAIAKKCRQDPEFENQMKEKYNLDAAKIQMMMEEIQEKTFDLMEFFATRNTYNFRTDCYGRSYTIPIVYIPDLLFKYSIKKIENYVTQNKIQLDHLIVPYKELDIKNGMYAQIEAIKRYLNQTKDASWPLVEENLKKYCHNDVLAMIMVFDLIKYLIKNN